MLGTAAAVGGLGAWILEVPSQRLLLTPEAARVLPPKAVVSSLADLLALCEPHSRHQLQMRVRACSEAKQTFDIELQLSTPSKAPRKWLRIIGSAVNEGYATTRIHGAVQDFTPFHDASQEARTVAARFTETLESLSDGYVILAPDWTILYVNAQAETMVGLQRGALLGRLLWADLAPGLNLSNEREVLTKSMLNRRSMESDLQVRGGSVHYHVKVSPSGQGLTLTIRDVTHERMQSRALEESRRSMSRLFGNLPGMAFRCFNDPDWPMEFVSEGALALTGHSPSQIMRGEPAYGQIVHAGDQARVWAEIQEALKRRERYQLTYRICTRGGEKWVWEQGTGVFGDEDELQAIEGFCTDITALVHAQQDVVRANEQLEDRVRERTSELEHANAELQAFSYSVAHDLRGPLTAIGGFAGLLQPDSPGWTRREHLLERIISNVKRMRELIDGLLSMADIARTELLQEPVDLAAISREHFEQMHCADPDRDAVLDAPSKLWVYGDPRLLRRLMENLLDNAWKYSGRQPSVRITVASRRECAGEVAYFVADKGCGFEMEHAPRIFQPFQRLHGSYEYEGLGVGLAIVQRIVSRQGGRIWAQSAPGDGATFYFTLPAPVYLPASAPLSP